MKATMTVQFRRHGRGVSVSMGGKTRYNAVMAQPRPITPSVDRLTVARSFRD